MTDDESKKIQNYPLELDAKAFESLVQVSMTHLQKFIKDLPHSKVADVQEISRIANLFKEPLPVKGLAFDTLMTTIFDQALSKGISYSHPGMMGGIPCGGILHSAVATLISSVVDRWPGLYNFAPAFIEMENSVIRWLAQIVGLPLTSGGNLTSGGSLANLNAVYIARNEKLTEVQIPIGTIYVSDQAHHSIMRSAKMSGILKSHIRLIETDEHCRMLIPALEKQIQEDKNAGLKPFLLVGAGGTVALGAVDDLTSLAKIAKREHLWYHVDAAWAGALNLTQRGKALLQGVEHADSVTIDPHTALFTPFGCGAVIVRDPACLRRAFDIDMNCNYLPTRDESHDLWNPSDNSPELSRNVRGLQVWLPLKLLGIGPFIEAMEEKITLSNYAYDALKAMPGIEFFCPPQLCVIAFRFKKTGSIESELDGLNQQLLERINQDGQIMLTGTKIKGKYYIRMVPFGYRTHKEHVDLALGLVKTALKVF